MYEGMWICPKYTGVGVGANVGVLGEALEGNVWAGTTREHICIRLHPQVQRGSRRISEVMANRLLQVNLGDECRQELTASTIYTA